jgi:murein DD-endopeptidase MepM/ murein hydrolase activator NlpD
MFTSPPLSSTRLRQMSNQKGATFGKVRGGGTRNHQGEDYAANVGEPVKAVQDGVIVSIGDGGDYGKTITLLTDLSYNGGKIYAFYAHLSSFRVKNCEKVKAGQIIGATGATGNARGMTTIAKGGHLHFEVRTQQSPPRGLAGRLNPKNWVRR